MRPLPLILILITTTVTLAVAETKLASIFTESMVLQQQDHAVIWGTDEPGQQVKITGAWGQAAEATADHDGNWRLSLKTPAAGGPYKLEVQGSSEINFDDVLIGEVWLCAGQSNMQMPVKGFNNQPINGNQEAILAANKDRIRAFTVKRNSSDTALDSVTGQWIPSSSATVGNFSATAYFFAKKLQETIDAPIGLIITSWGGSSAEAWTDVETLERLGISKDAPNGDKAQQRQPTKLYNAMLHPLIGYKLKGSIWYQGESNRNRAHQYRDLVTAMVSSWREQWGQGDFPFYYVQIAPFNYDTSGSNSAYLREAQLQTMQTLKNSGMAVTLDIGDPKFIHPREKKEIGERLAYWALNKDYGIEGIETTGPLYQSHTVDDDGKVLVAFEGTTTGISSFGKPFDGFELAGADKVFHPANVKLSKKANELTVWSKEVPEPVALRYAFENTPNASLFSTYGLPASSFRTDDWIEE
ncbi:MAG TPA: sialate O-acetylesterase [Opitutae bacterium]|nr:sialate O-acetylesterase [Opitutae bacterium]